MSVFFFHSEKRARTSFLFPGSSEFKKVGSPKGCYKMEQDFTVVTVKKLKILAVILTEEV